MSRINTNISSLIAQNVLSQQNTALSTSLERLSTGLQINHGSDNPAGLIASQQLQSEQASITAAVGNAQSANQVINTADGGLQEVNSLLLQVQSLIGESANDAGLSTDEKQANQLQIDSILQSIDRIASTTSFDGTNLLNGTYDFQVTGQSTKVQNFQINAAKLNTGATRSVQVVVTNSAQHGALYLSAGGSALDLSAATASFQFQLAGAQGSRQFTFASGTTLAAIASAVNTFTSVTGVSAVASGNFVGFKSTGFGSDNFVSFKLTNRGGQAGTVFQASAQNEKTYTTAGKTAFTALTNAVQDSGQDLGATINGIAATSKGTTTNINTDFLDLSLTLSATAAQTLGAFNAFTITGGGAKFNIGPNVDILNQASIGIQDVSTNNLGNTADGFLSSLASGQTSNVVDGDLGKGQTIVNDAINQISTLRGRLGAFQSNVLTPTINSLGVALENTSAAESQITDTDFAAETANLTRSQILVSAATQVLSIANSTPQNVLTLLKSA